MVFSSIPAYLDPPNWQQQQQQQTNHQQHQHGSSSDDHNPQLQPPAPPSLPGGGANSGSVRPASMADRARLAKVPQPEVALKCPRCESTNTKFCYFNNYSLTQPRHFCKTCRRYWTRGGALRNVPVGGGCRRNKRSKGSGSKSPATSEQQRQSGPGSTNSNPSNSCTNDIMCHMTHQPPTQLPFMASLHHLTDYGGDDIGLNFGGIQPQVVAPSGGGGSGRSDMDFHMGNSSGGGGGGDHDGNILSSGGSEQWRMQQFPFLAGLHPQQGLYPFEGEGVEQGYGGGFGQLRARPPCSMAMHGQMSAPSVKTEGDQGLNLSRQFLGIPGNDQYLGGNAWTDLSGFTSSSTNHML